MIATVALTLFYFLIVLLVFIHRDYAAEMIFLIIFLLVLLILFIAWAVVEFMLYTSASVVAEFNQLKTARSRKI